MPLIRAKRVEAALDPNVPFMTRAEFMDSLAALSALYSDDVRRVARSTSRPIWRMLQCAASPSRMEWLFNNIRMRHRLPSHVLTLLPSGTTSNEALHAEINGWFRQTQQVYKASLRLKLRIMGLAKLMAHDACLHFPTIRQIQPAAVLARATANPLWTATTWRRWCVQMAEGDRCSKAELPEQANRRRERDIMRRWALKRPAAAKRPAASAMRDRRTPFNRLRSAGLRTGGVKPAMRRPAASV